MPLDAISLELALFLGLLTILASLPTDPYFHPWHDGPPSYRISHDHRRPPLLGRGDPLVESQVFAAFGPRNFSRGLGEPGFFPYGTPPQDRWYRLERGGRGPQAEALPPQVPPLRQSASRRRSSEPAPVDQYSGVQNIGNSYSSHVNCEAANQKAEAAEKSRKNTKERSEPGFGGGDVDERINFEEGSRTPRTGTPKEVDPPHPRIVTPKGGRRPSQGASPAKNQNKPFNPGATNTISTTEKASRNQTTKGSKKPRPSSSKPSGGGDIVFPDGYPKKFVPRVSKCAKKSTFCEHLGEEYPSDYISQVLKKEGAMFREFFGRDVISDPNITERINAPEENSLCPYRQEVVFPRAAQNKEDKWLFIINQDQYVQGVTVEVCLNPESRCILTEGFPLGYTPYCKQKYIERRLVAIGEDGKPHSDSFRLPSCCSCVVKHETSARMGLLRPSRGVRGASPSPRH